VPLEDRGQECAHQVRVRFLLSYGIDLPEVATLFSQSIGWYAGRWHEREKSGRWWGWVKDP
jgi:hypothetical protein